MQELSGFFKILKLVLKNRKLFLIINVSILIITIVILLLLPKWYKSSVSVFVSQDKSTDFSMNNVLQGLPLDFGGSQYETVIDLNKALINSRLFMDKIITRFNLDSAYDTEYKEDTYSELRNNLILVDNENGTFNIVGYFKENPDSAAAFVDFASQTLISTSITMNQKSADQYREFIAMAYNETNRKLSIMEDSLKKYQIETGIFQLENQLLLSLEQLSELEAEKIKHEIELEYALKTYKRENKTIESMRSKINILQNKIDSFKETGNYSNLAIRSLPVEGLKYFRIYREVMIGAKLISVLLPQLEKARIDALKSVSNMVIIDLGLVPSKKHSPKRLLILTIVLFFSVLSSILIIFLKEFVIENQNIFKSMLTDSKD